MDAVTVLFAYLALPVAAIILILAIIGRVE